MGSWPLQVSYAAGGGAGVWGTAKRGKMSGTAEAPRCRGRAGGAGRGQRTVCFTALLRTGSADGLEPVDSGEPAVSHTCPLHPPATPWPLPLGPEASFVTQHSSGGLGLVSS